MLLLLFSGVASAAATIPDGVYGYFVQAAGNTMSFTAADTVTAGTMSHGVQAGDDDYTYKQDGSMV